MRHSPRIGLDFVGFEIIGPHELRARFEVDQAGQRFTATAVVIFNGDVIDLQASDRETAGSTGRSVVDALIRSRVRTEIRRGRGAAVLRRLDQMGREWAGRPR